MRTLIPLLLLAAVSYVGWTYWEDYTDRPLRENLLRTDFERLMSLEIETSTGSLRCTKTDNDWVVNTGRLEVFDHGERVVQLLERLQALRTDSVMAVAPQQAAGFRLTLREAARTPTKYGARAQVPGETVKLWFPPGQPPLAQIEATGDVFALRPALIADLPALLTPSTYRGSTTLDVSAAAVDSVLVYRNDSLLWATDGADPALLLSRWLAPAPAPNAPYFDEVMDREYYYATLHLREPSGREHLIEVYRDSSWQKPYVLVGADYPRRYFAVDSLVKGGG